MSYQSPLNYEFIRIPLPIKKRKDLKQPAKDFYGYLCKCAHLADKDGYIRIKKATITDRIGMPKSTIKRASEEVVGRGLALQRKVGRLMEYKLLPIDQNGQPEFIPDYKPVKQKSPVKKAEEKIKRAHTMGRIEKQVEPDKGAHTMGHKRGPHHGPDKGPHHGPLHKIAPINIKESPKNHSKEMLPQGIFFEKYGDKIPKGIDGQFRQKQLDSYYLKYGDEFVKICLDSASLPLLKRARYVQGAVNKLDNKAKMDNERINAEQNEQYKSDLVYVDDNLSKLAAGIGETI